MLKILEDLEVPIIGAPMAGGPSTPELVSAVDKAGGLGFLAAGMKSAAAMRAEIAAVRSATDRPFGVNLFVPQPRFDDDAALAAYADEIRADAARYDVEVGAPAYTDDDWAAKIETLVADPVPLVTFTFGAVDPAIIAGLQAVGTVVGMTVTSAIEAKTAADAGADLIVVQGHEAGGHRGCWSLHEPPNSTGIADLLPEVGAAVDLPIVAAGGVGSPAELRSLLELGAQAVAVGTLFVAADESGAPEAYKNALTDPAFEQTAVTRALTGRLARGLLTDFIRSHDGKAPAAYPQVGALTAPLRAAATAAADPHRMTMWAGTNHQAAVRRPVADIVHYLRP